VKFLAANSTSTISNVEPGLLGFLVVAGLGVALVLLLRSMNKQFRKLGPRPDEPEETEAAGASSAPGRPLRGLAAHRAAMAANAEAEAKAKPGARPSEGQS
jgi:hypothetical protein